MVDEIPQEVIAEFETTLDAEEVEYQRELATLLGYDNGTSFLRSTPWRGALDLTPGSAGLELHDEYRRVRGYEGWEEEKHPRQPAGSDRGGEFTGGEGGAADHTSPVASIDAAGHGIVVKGKDGHDWYGGVQDNEWQVWAGSSDAINKAINGDLKAGDSDSLGGHVTAADIDEFRELGGRIQQAASSNLMLNPATGNTFYRGDSFNSEKELLGAFKPRSLITLNRLTSTATDQEKADAYIEEGLPVKAIFRVQNPYGVRGIETAPLGVAGGEIVLPKGDKYRVMGVSRPNTPGLNNKTWVIDLYSNVKHKKLNRVKANYEQRNYGKSFLRSTPWRGALDLTPGNVGLRLHDGYKRVRGYHLPGEHEQETHGNRGEGGGVTDKTLTVINNVIMDKATATKLHSETLVGGATVARLSEAYITGGDQELVNYVNNKGGPDDLAEVAARPTGMDPTPYQNYAAAAKMLVNEIRSSTPVPVVLYRGISARDRIVALDNATAGQTLTLDRISAFTFDRDRAAYYTNYKEHTYLLQLDGSVKGIATDSLTGLLHREFITQGKFEVISVSAGPRVKLPSAYRGAVKFSKLIKIRQVGVF